MTRDERKTRLRDATSRSTPARRLRLYVSPRGDDRSNGRAAAAGRKPGHGPFASLGHALAVAAQSVAAKPGRQADVVVALLAGDHRLARGIVLDGASWGPGDVRLRITSAGKRKARLLGGARLVDFRPVSDPAVLARLPEAARAQVVEADLRAHGIEDFGTLRSRGFARRVTAAHLELFLDGTPLTVARWPNDGYLRIAGFPADAAISDQHGGTIGALEHGFFYEGDRPGSWASAEGIWVHGYWAWDWANSYEAVASIDLERRLVKTRPPHGNYGFRTGNRFCFLNVLEELDSPGEYVVDARKGVVYLWPPGALAGAELLASVVEEPMLTLDGLAGATIEAVRFEASRGQAIAIRGGRDNTIQGCAFANLGTTAITIEGGYRHRVRSCDIAATGEGGIALEGGDRSTLVPGGHEATNNHIRAIGRWSRTYCPAIHAQGVGIRIANNLMHDLPHIAIIFLGNEILIERNRIHRATLETGDAGAIYTGRDYTARGNVIRHNFIHDMGGYGMGTMGVYLDDCVSGQTVHGNVFVRVQRAAFIGGGRDNLVVNNVFVECAPALAVDARGLDPAPVWRDMIHGYMKGLLDRVDHRAPPYSVRYPELAALDRYYASDSGIPPEGNVIARNLCVASSWMNARWHPVAESYLTITDNLLTDARHFVDAAAGDFRIRKGAALRAMGFEDIPFREIGLRRDRFRSRLPPQPPVRHRGGVR